MRFEVGAAYGMGICLPLLETLRRRTNFENISGYVDDYIVGGMLLYAAYCVTHDRRAGPVLLVIAWAVLCGGLWGSFFYQLWSSEPQDVSGLPNLIVVVVKGVLYAISLTALWLSARSAIAAQPARSG